MEDMLEAEIWTVARTDQGNAVLLRPLGSDTVVPIFVGQLEAQSILIGFGDVKVKRPLACDLFFELARQIGLTLFRVEVHEIRDNTFFARLLLAGREFSEAKPLILDSRPSDAFALAVRHKCPVFISPRVVEQAGIPADLVIEDVGEFAKEAAQPTSPAPGTPLTAKRRRLQAELEQVVAAEKYERAAEIRDLLILLEQEIEQEQENKGQ